MSDFTPQEIEEILQEFFDVVGTRQYIGARYVPIYGRVGDDSVEWDNSAPYEPLTIVSHLGNTYTSRTYVPAGVDITDTHYWALTANYNAQVEAYREETARVSEQLTTPQEAIDATDALIPADEFDADNTVKDYINHQIATTGRHILAIGDSWTAESGDTRWPSQYRKIAPMDSLRFYAHGGYSIGSSTSNFAELVADAIADTSYDHDEIDTIIIVGGVNDRISLIDAATYTLPALVNIVTTLRTEYPNASIYYFYNNFTPVTTTVYNNALTIINGIIRATGIQATALFGVVPIADYQSDQIHPTSYVYDYVANAIHTFITGGQIYRPPRFTVLNSPTFSNNYLLGTVRYNEYWRDWFDYGCNLELAVNTTTEQVETTITIPKTAIMSFMPIFLYGGVSALDVNKPVSGTAFGSDGSTPSQVTNFIVTVKQGAGPSGAAQVMASPRHTDLTT